MNKTRASMWGRRTGSLVFISMLIKQEAPAEADPQESLQLCSAGSDLESYFPVRQKHGSPVRGDISKLARQRNPRLNMLKRINNLKGKCSRGYALLSQICDVQLIYFGIKCHFRWTTLPWACVSTPLLLLFFYFTCNLHHYTGMLILCDTKNKVKVWLRKFGIS